MWSLLFITVVLLQVLTLVLVGHPMSRELAMDILDRVLWFLANESCKFGIRCLEWGIGIMDHPSMDRFQDHVRPWEDRQEEDNDDSDDGSSDNSAPPPPPPPPCSGAGAVILAGIIAARSGGHVGKSFSMQLLRDTQ